MLAAASMQACATNPAQDSSAAIASSTQTVLTPGDGRSFVDGSGHTWSLGSAGDALEDGIAVPGGSGTAELTYVSSTQLVWGQDAVSGRWYSWDGTTWIGPASTSPIDTTVWTHCAAEHEVCAFSGTATVRYGADGVFVTRTVANGISCSNDVFGDPLPGVFKRCDVSSDPTPPGGNYTVSATLGFAKGNGQPWNMKGLNATVQDALQGFPMVLQQYPGLTAIRLNCVPGTDSSASIAQVVQQYTARGVVVEIEDHSGIGDNVAWYQEMANAYKANPQVFLETPNEPGDPSTAQFQVQIIGAIRATGFPNPIGLQPLHGYDYSNLGTVVDHVGTHQLFLTPHIYYGVDDPNGAAQYAENDIHGAASLGLFPCIDEFGDAEDGFTRDPQGASVITAMIAVNDAGRAGALFWAMDNGNHPDGADSAFLTPDGNQLTSVGQRLQAWLH
jgi:hypothetical protein